MLKLLKQLYCPVKDTIQGKQGRDLNMNTAQSRAKVQEEQSHEAILEAPLVCQHFHMFHVSVHVFHVSFYLYLHKTVFAAVICQVRDSQHIEAIPGCY